MSTTLDLTIDQGATHVFTFTVKDENSVAVDISTWDANLQVRQTYDSPTALISASTDDVTNTLEVTDGVNGKLSWNIAESDTTGIQFPSGSESMDCVYDIELRNGSNVYKAARGTITINREVTKIPTA